MKGRQSGAERGRAGPVQRAATLDNCPEDQALGFLAKGSQRCGRLMQRQSRLDGGVVIVGIERAGLAWRAERLGRTVDLVQQP